MKILLNGEAKEITGSCNLSHALEELSIEQLCCLAVIPRRPSGNNPLEHPQVCAERACELYRSLGNSSAASGASAPSSEKVLRVATNAEFAPFESKNPDGSLSGFDIDLINALAKEAGYRVEFKDQSWDSLFNSLRNGDADVFHRIIAHGFGRRVV